MQYIMMCLRSALCPNVLFVAYGTRREDRARNKCVEYFQQNALLKPSKI